MEKNMNAKPIVLIVDDEKTIHNTLEALLHDEYRLYFAQNGMEGLALAVQTLPDVILLDVMMPHMDGFEVCRRLRATEPLAEVPIIMITALDDRESRLQGLRAGADDFLTKPFDVMEMFARIQTITRLNRYRRLLEQKNQIENLHQELLTSYHKTIEGWSNALDLRDKETEGHTQRVTQVCVEFARAVGLSENELDFVRMGSLLHDVGKLGVPDSILMKPDKLTDEEWAIMHLHPVYAYEWLAPITFLKNAVDIPYCHHEKWDGSGYPRGLRGEEIPLLARLFAIVDVWDALSSDRPYRPALPENEVLEYIRNQSGLHFDPSLVPTFMELIKNGSGHTASAERNIFEELPRVNVPSIKD
jgi:putative two-component system response regulator